MTTQSATMPFPARLRTELKLDPLLLLIVAILLLGGFVVLAAELMNSAIERAVDLAQPDIDPVAKAAKDAGSAAVAVSAIAALAAWIAVIGGLIR